MGSSVEILDYNDYTREKTLKLHAEMDGWYDYVNGIPAKATDCLMYVNGEEVENVNGEGTYKITKNGTYNIEIRPWYYDEGNTYTMEVDTIDDKKPSYQVTKSFYKAIQEGVTYGVKLNVTAQDNHELKSIFIDGTEYTAEGYEIITKSRNISRSGDYNVKIVDKAGNEYESTEHVEVDNVPPQIVNCTVVKDSNIGYKGNVGDTPYCVVKPGDKIDITLKADETIKGYGGIFGSNVVLATIDGLQVKRSEEFVRLDEDSDTIKLSIDLNDDIMAELVDENGKISKFAKLKIHGITDLTNNKTDYEINNLLYIDNTAPTIEKVEISGGGKSSVPGLVYVKPGTSINLDIYADEKLSKDIKVKIGECETYAKYNEEKYLNGKRLYVYKVKVSSDLVVNMSNINDNTVVPVVLTNIRDLAGNAGSKVTINENNKSTNGEYLYYGMTEDAGIVYIASEPIQGVTGFDDVNKDGLVANYDALLYLRYCLGLEENENNFFDQDGDGNITSADSVKLGNNATKIINEMAVNESKTFKALKGNKTQLTGDKVVWELLDKNKQPIDSNNNSIVYNINEETGELTIVPQNAKIQEFTIKATYQNGGDIYNGETKIKVINNLEYVSYEGYIKILSPNGNTFDILGDVNRDGYITKLDSIILQMYDLGIIELESEDDYTLERCDLNGDRRISLRDASMALKILEKYNTLKKGDTLNLDLLVNDHSVISGSQEEKRLKSFSYYKDDSIENQIQWEVLGDPNGRVLAVSVDNDGKAEIRANGNAGDKAILKVTAKFPEDESIVVYFNIEIVDNIDINLSKDKIEYDLTDNIINYSTINANVNIPNKLITWRSEDESIARIEVNKSGACTVIPVKEGKTIITATCDGVTKSCEVNIIKGINEITVDKTSVTLKESLEESINITKNANATEAFELNSLDESVARIYYNEGEGTYKIKAINKGETDIKVYGDAPQLKLKFGE